MPIPIHIISRHDGGSASFQDRLIIATKFGVTNAAGSGAGANVTTSVTFTDPLPASYMVVVNTNQGAAGWVTSKTTSGFTVNMSPVPATLTIASGTFDVLVLA